MDEDEVLLTLLMVVRGRTLRCGSGLSVRSMNCEGGGGLLLGLYGITLAALLLPLLLPGRGMNICVLLPPLGLNSAVSLGILSNTLG